LLLWSARLKGAQRGLSNRKIHLFSQFGCAAYFCQLYTPYILPINQQHWMTYPDNASLQMQSAEPNSSAVDATPAQPPTPSQSPPPSSKSERRHSVLGHAARRSFGGSDGLSLLRLPSHHNQSNKEHSLSSTTQPEGHTFNNIDDFDIKSPIGQERFAFLYISHIQCLSVIADSFLKIKFIRLWIFSCSLWCSL
jgi:hypothetical protein